MAQIIFNRFQLFADVPYNIWPWLFLISAPLLIFSAKPHHSARWRFWRILLATTVGYVLINLTLHTHRELDWKEYEKCNTEHGAWGANEHPKCKSIVNIADGASYAFYLILGWIPAAAYAGFWEFSWRRKYGHIIRLLGKRYKGKWFSTTLIICSIPVWLYIMLLMSIVVARIFDRLFT